METLPHDKNHDRQLQALKQALTTLVETGINNIAGLDLKAARQLEGALIGETHRLEMILTYPVLSVDVFLSPSDSDPGSDPLFLFRVEEVRQTPAQH